MTYAGSHTLGAEEAIPADSGPLTQLRLSVESAGADLQRTIAGVSAQRAPAGWTGEAQQKYTHQIDTVSNELKEVLTSLDNVERLVAGFASRLSGDYEATAERLAREIAQAEAQVHSLAALHGNAVMQRKTALSDSEASLDSTRKAVETSAYQSADARVATLANDLAAEERLVAQLRALARENWDHYTAAAKAFCNELVNVAASVGVSPVWQSSDGMAQRAYDASMWAYIYANAAENGV